MRRKNLSRLLRLHLLSRARVSRLSRLILVLVERLALLHLLSRARVSRLSRLILVLVERLALQDVQNILVLVLQNVSDVYRQKLNVVGVILTMMIVLVADVRLVLTFINRCLAIVVLIDIKTLSVYLGDKMVTEEELLSDIAKNLQNNDNLCQLIFDEHNQAYDYVRQGLLKIANFIVDQGRITLSSLVVDDIVLAGGMASYIYNAETDVDIGIIAHPDMAKYDPKVVQNIFRAMNDSLPTKGYRFNILSRNIDYGFVEPSQFLSGGRSYSLLNNSWLQMPQHREFSFSVQEIFEAYKAYCDKVYLFVNSLEKIDGKWLTFESCNKLQEHLDKLREDALRLKENGPEQEYGLEYNVHRFFNKFGVRGHFEALITEAHNQLVNVLEIEDA